MKIEKSEHEILMSKAIAYVAELFPNTESIAIQIAVSGDDPEEVEHHQCLRGSVGTALDSSWDMVRFCNVELMKSGVPNSKLAPKLMQEFQDAFKAIGGYVKMDLHNNVPDNIHHLHRARPVTDQ
jgi:hypothetical protein